MTELKPCPFCGGKPNLHKADKAMFNPYEIRCPNGDCTAFSTAFFPSEHEAIHAWNKRAPEGKGNESI